MSNSNSSSDDIKFDTELNSVPFERRLKNFSDLLNDIHSLDEKKRMLWLEIYENAITDRQNAYASYCNLAQIAKNKSSENAVHGKTMVAFLDRMGKANDQLIKLAELIAKAKTEDENVTPEELYSRIGA